MAVLESRVTLNEIPVFKYIEKWGEEIGTGITSTDLDEICENVAVASLGCATKVSGMVG